MSDRAICFVRASQGDDGKESLEYQREVIPETARNLVGDDGEVDVIDLGIHTGFSTYTRHPDEYDRELLDHNEDVQRAVEEIEDGVYDFIVARDKERISRDDYFKDFKRAAMFGEAEFVFTDSEGEDVDSISSEVTHVIAKKKKQEEIEAAKEAKRRRQEKGYPDGRPPYGLEYNTDKTGFRPKKGEYEEVERIFELADDGVSQREIAEKVDAGIGTVNRILNNRERYDPFLDELVEDSAS